MVIKRFESFMTSNCYVVVPEKNSSICYLIDLPPDFDSAIQYINNKGGNLLFFIALLFVRMQPFFDALFLVYKL